MPEVLKLKGKVYGGKFTADEKKAIEIEVKRTLAEYERKHYLEVDAMILWHLHELFGFGPKRLKKFYKAFEPAVKALIRRYELEDSDQIWLCTEQLKTIGADLEEWEREKNEA